MADTCATEMVADEHIAGGVATQAAGVIVLRIAS
jgi:hypothetical protein